MHGHLKTKRWRRGGNVTNATLNDRGLRRTIPRGASGVRSGLPALFPLSCAVESGSKLQRTPSAAATPIVPFRPFPTATRGPCQHDAQNNDFPSSVPNKRFSASQFVLTLFTAVRTLASSFQFLNETLSFNPVAGFARFELFIVFICKRSIRPHGIRCSDHHCPGFDSRPHGKLQQRGGGHRSRGLRVGGLERERHNSRHGGI